MSTDELNRDEFDFLITSTNTHGALIAWQGRRGWFIVDMNRPHSINLAFAYRGLKRADKVIDRMRNKYPGSGFWKRAAYCAFEDAYQNPNCLGLDWVTIHG